MELGIPLRSVTLLALQLALNTVVFSQSQPSAQSIPYTTDFGSLAHASTTYPAGWQGWSVSGSPSGFFATGSPTGNQAMIPSSTASNATFGVHNYNQKLGLLSGAGVNPGIVLAVSTVGGIDVEVEYLVGTLRDPYNGTSNTRINAVTLQYRVGISGAFTTLSSVNYQSTQTPQVATVTTPVDPSIRSVTLPSACNDKPVIQLRWVVRDVSGVGARPSFFVDDVTVSPGAICTENVVVELRTDLNSQDASWEIVSPESNVVLCSGGGYPSNITTPISNNCCLPEGCYRLVVFDAAGDGFGTNGGYQLRLAVGDPRDARVIDNIRNFADGFESFIGNGPGDFCFPMSTQKPIFTSRDKLDWLSNQYLVAEPDAAVSAQWVEGAPDNLQSSTTGYQFWFFDPNGTYSYRRGRAHSSSDGFGPADAIRACHMKINNWALANQIPANVLMNVRIRTRVNGTYGAFGPAYRFVIDPQRALCPLTKLNDIPDQQYESCNKVRNWGTGNWVHARPVGGANRYQFRFRIPAENFVVAITSNTYFLQLNWANNALQAGKTYLVDVRASKDNGATWCSNFIAPALNPWGDLCNLTIAANAQDAEQDLGLAKTSSGSPTLWPNPNTGDQLWIDLSGIEVGDETDTYRTIAVDIIDMTGKQIVTRMIPTQGDRSHTVLDLNGALATGIYLVNITAGEKRWTERLVIAN